VFSGKKVLVVAAHPDDDVLGCGGIMAKYKDESEFRVIFLAEGSSCRHDSASSATPTQESELLSRSRDSVAALLSLGVTDVHFHNLRCGALNMVPTIELNHIIEKHVATFKPDYILTHGDMDINNDHRLVRRSADMAARPTGLNAMEGYLSFEVLSSSEWNSIHPPTVNLFVELEERHVEAKWAALEHFESEVRCFPHPRSRTGLFTLAHYRGMQSGFDYAEAFSVIRMIVK
jgi:LmbE family N-acetylglucosaminyl deacetylase